MGAPLPLVAVRPQPAQLGPLDTTHPMYASLADVWVPAVSSRGLLTGIDSLTVAGGKVKAVPGGLGFNTTSTSRRYSTSILNGQHAAWLIVAYRDGSGNVEQSVVRKDGTITPLQDWDGDVRIAKFDGGGNFAGTTSYGSPGTFANRLNV